MTIGEEHLEALLAVQFHFVCVAPFLDSAGGCLVEFALPGAAGHISEKVVGVLDELDSVRHVLVDVRDENEEQDWSKDASLYDSGFDWHPVGEDVSRFDSLLPVGEIGGNP